MPRNPANQNPKPGRIRPIEQEPSAIDRDGPASPNAPLPADPATAKPKPSPEPTAIRPKLKKTAKPQPKPASDLVAAEIASEKRLAIAREELFFRRHELLAQGRDLSVDEYRILKMAQPRTPGEVGFAFEARFSHFVGREDARVTQILDLQNRSGKPADRTAADKRAEEKANALAKEAPGLEEQIRGLQAKLGALHQAAADAKSAAAARHAADENLRDEKLLPRFVTDELTALKRRHTDAFGRELLNLESRRTRIQGIIAMDVSTPEGLENAKHHVGCEPRFGPDTMARQKTMFQFTSERTDGTHHRFSSLRPGVWVDYINDLREELVGVEARIAEITNGCELAEADAEIEKLRGFYCPK